MKNSSILIVESSIDYALLDSGDGEKLERFGEYILSRPDPQALWHKRLPVDDWKKADGFFTRGENKGDWSLSKSMQNRWAVELGGLKMWVRPTAFKHVGIFPEQVKNWQWMRDVVTGKADVEVLNLFGYTGGATLALAQAGAKVVHVDGSKVAITWARDNAELLKLREKPIRWILDDARSFVKREIKRNKKYDGIVMDPPAFGRGPEGELWKIEEHFLPLIDDCFKILKDRPLFFLVNGYSSGYSALAYGNILSSLQEKFGGEIEIGELVIQEASIDYVPKNMTADQISGARLLPCGMFARWSNGA
jgi:23S rRNA (cytosine1962-C5)-methyltransferase